ncbi:DUF1559 family PulG-like putative transporter [Aquisphaera insulae]|uniref:DUF1559 family PulG-like putative transporter n=1 Tax=Aquisphaera insulae TaxID=2712864 RepID=UPI0013ECC56A|nr:DUF1559 domain-containing protein [Aquisphaera insulae]
MPGTFDHDPEFAGTIQKPRRRRYQILKHLGCLGVMVLWLILSTLAYEHGRHAASRGWCGNNLKQIALAMRSYEDDYHALPPACTVDANGRRLHSWRTLILPYLDQEALYKSIDLSKPWDDPANAKARAAMPSVYRCYLSKAPKNTTTYLANAAEGGCLVPGRPRRLDEITDGLLWTLLAIEVDEPHAVPWMAPIDADEALILGLSPGSKLTHAGGVNAAFGGGDATFMKATKPAQTRRDWISIAGGDGICLEGYYD